MISIIDLGISNTGSVQRAFQQIGVNSQIITTAEEVVTAPALFLPGVGAYGAGMARIDRMHLRQAILEAAKKETPMMAVCLGMQLLFDGSDEAPDQPGLGLLPGTAALLKPAPGEMVPNMGWCDIQDSQTTTHQGCYYFVHSYAVPVSPALEPDTAGTLSFGQKQYYAWLRRGTLEACQFHPEKSQQDGLALLAGFVRRAKEARS